MAENDNRYGSNRNQWRKVYGYSRRKPNIVQVYDRDPATGEIPTSGTLRSFDANKILRHRDFFLFQGVTSGSYLVLSGGVISTEIYYDEGLVAFNDETSVLDVTYSINFPGNPVVTFTIDPPTGAYPVINSQNIQVFGLSTPTATSMDIGTSAPFTGNIRYRAVFTQVLANYPFYGTSSYSASITMSANIAGLNNQNDYTASYTELSSGAGHETFMFLQTIHHNGTLPYNINVAKENDSFSNTSSLNHFSEYVTSNIHFMAFNRPT